MNILDGISNMASTGVFSNQSAQQSVINSAAQNSITIGQGSGGTMGITTNGTNVGSIPYQYYNIPHTPTKYSDVVESVILGEMHKYNIGKEELTIIKKEIYFVLMESILNGIANHNYHDAAYNECEKILPKWKFKNDMNSLLNEEESEKK